MYSLKIIYIEKDLSNPDDELFLIEAYKKKKCIKSVKITREYFKDIDGVYDKFAKREYSFFEYSIERPEYISIQISKKEYDSLFATVDEIPDDKELIKFHDELNLLLYLLTIERDYQMSKSEFWKLENRTQGDKLVDILQRDIHKYKNKDKK